MQKGNALYPVSLAALRTGRLMPVASRSGAMITTTATSPARAFRGRCTVIVAMRMHAGRRPAGAMLLRRRRNLAAALGAAILAGQVDADQPFDVAQIPQLLSARDQRDRSALGAGPRGAANAVDIGFRHVGQVEIDDMADTVDVDAARGDVGGHQRADLSGSERAEHALAMFLRLVAVNGFRSDAGPGQALHHLVGAVLGAGEDQRAIDPLLLQELGKESVLGREID